MESNVKYIHKYECRRERISYQRIGEIGGHLVHIMLKIKSPLSRRGDSPSPMYTFEKEY